MADIGDTVAPKADQMINEDLMDGPRTFTISRVVVKSGADQPVDVYLEEFGPLPYRPSKGMRNVMIAGWGKESKTYAGKRLTLYRDPDVRFGKDRLGGIRISHMSHLSGPLEVPLRTTRGKRATFTVKPLAASVPAKASPVTPADLVAAFVAAGLTEQADRLAYCTDVVGREIASSSDLTENDARAVLAALNADKKE